MPQWMYRAAGDAFTMADTVGSQIGAYNADTASSERLRGLLSLFFGITSEEGFQLSPSSVASYDYVKSARLPLIQPSYGGSDWFTD